MYIYIYIYINICIYIPYTVYDNYLESSITKCSIIFHSV